MPNVTLPLRVAKDDPNKEAVAFESGDTQQVWDEKAGKLVDRPKWNWVARSHIHGMEPGEGDFVNATITEWIAKKKGMI